MKKDKLKKRLVSIKSRLGLDRLQKREKRVLLAGLIFVLGFLILQLAVLPYMDARERLGASLRKNEKELVDIQLLRQEYLELKSKQSDIRSRLGKRAEGFSLFSFLEEKTTAINIKDRVTYMKPSRNEVDDGLTESIVEMKIEEIGLKQLVDFLAVIESRENVVAVQRISIQESSQREGLLDTVVRIMTYEPSGT